MKVTISLERPKGVVVTSWTMVAKSCDSGTLLYNGISSYDSDEDFVPLLKDACPTLQAFTANGCPVRGRTLTLAAKSHPRRVVGRLFASGFPLLYAGRPVTIWKVRPGPDRKMATKTTTSLGTFKAKVGKGKYYATSPEALVPAVGLSTADKSGTVRVH